MKNRNSKKANQQEIVYSIRYGSLHSGTESPRVHPLLSQKSLYELRDASDNYLSRMARILKRDGFKEEEHMEIQFSFLRRRK